MVLTRGAWRAAALPRKLFYEMTSNLTYLFFMNSLSLSLSLSLCLFVVAFDTHTHSYHLSKGFNLSRRVAGEDMPENAMTMIGESKNIVFERP